MSPGYPEEIFNNLFSALGEVKRSLKDLYESEENKIERSLNSSSFDEARQTLDAQEKSLMTQIVFTALELKDYSLAITVITNLFKTLKNDTALHSLLGRIYLQFGDLDKGERCIRLADNSSSEEEGSQSVRGLLDEGILAFARGEFQQAYDYFLNASLINPSDLVVRNNCAVCLLYLCRAKDAVSVLTDAVDETSNTNLQAYLRLNLSTMKELEGFRRTVDPLAVGQ